MSSLGYALAVPCAVMCAAALGCQQKDLVVARVIEQAGVAGSAGSTGGAGAEAGNTGSAGAAAGEGDAGSGGTVGSDPCPVEPWFFGVAFAATMDCRVPESQQAAFDQLARWIMEGQTPTSAESRGPDPCDFGGSFFYVDPEDPTTYVLCESACMVAKFWHEQALREQVACQQRIADGGAP